MNTTGPDSNADKTPRNPFEAPRARVDDSGPENLGMLLTEPRVVEAGRGFAWLGEGWELFKEAPGPWIGVFVVWMVVSVVLSLIPLVNIFSGLLNPVFSAGMMYGCHSLAQGRGLAVGHLFEGFQRRFGNLVMIGLIAIIAGVVIFLSAFLGVLGGAGALSILSRGEMSEVPDPIALLLALLVVLALMVPLMMALWFAPGLSILHGQSPLRALSLSFQGCLRNLMPFLTYGLGTLGLAILATLPLGLGWLVLGPVLVTSTYAAYREIFTA